MKNNFAAVMKEVLEDLEETVQSRIRGTRKKTCRPNRVFWLRQMMTCFCSSWECWYGRMIRVFPVPPTDSRQLPAAFKESMGYAENNRYAL